ncbi:guanine deaminase [Liquorilactobacillus cacaonum]|uniref:Guanine deaminase n=1 Tax=Liquorilactobacillus cacaonum DSM 21116 TaxID=1423729 RepID=A0A0R2CKS3_9LACO|nr:guanine deaminase [Liquorilactobacillus cacaonum]KRM91957.1 guanine deaminase [Liquorilactobacillus cacaonum DSM 21116]
MQVFKGNFFHTPVYGKVEYLRNGLLLVNERGIIIDLVLSDNPSYSEIFDEARTNGSLIDFDDKCVLPGFVDLHIHAPQWPQAGVALDEPLNVWLDECTFPLEAKYANIDFAKKVYSDLVQQLINRGTTTAVYFATQHLNASIELARISSNLGQRAFVGKVVMDNQEQTHDYYRDVSSEQAILDTEKFIKAVRKLGEDVKQGVYPVVTPRFVPSCTDQTLEALGKLAKEYDTYIQTHCSEGQWEHDYVVERFGKRDTEVLADYGLLTNKSIMDHCNFIDERDGEIFAKHGAAIAHCPISNAYFANGVLPVKRLKQQGVKLGLGTDISGGFSPSLYDNIKQTVISSRMLTDGVDVKVEQEKRGVFDSKVSILESFYLATKGGGEALNLPVGTFEKGQIFDAQVLDSSHLPGFSMYKTPSSQLAKLLYLSEQTDISEVWIQGIKVK